MVGRTLSHYRIVGQLGAGGMGVVYSAEDIRLGRPVALKFVSEYLAADPQAFLRLRSEARAASALNHPNICTIYDIGEDAGHPFIVMELMKGQTLRDRLLHGQLKVQQLVEIGIDVADALHAAHSEGIIHRDIKPGNIFLTERGHVKILDFGLAKLTSARHTTSTTTEDRHTSAAGVTHGTTAYMSPEQATGEQLDGRTDLFSLGVVLYECATGQHPFPGKTSAMVVAAILDRVPPAPLARNPDLPLRLNEIISNCLEKDRELRYQSAADLRADLKRLKRDLDSGHMRSVEAGSAAAVLPRHTPASGMRVPHTPPSGDRRGSGSRRDLDTAADREAPSRRRTSFVWLAAAGALASAISAGVWMLAPDGTPSRTDVAADGPAVPSTQAQMTLAAATLDAGNYRAALAYAREVLAIEPTHADAARIRDRALEVLSRFDDLLDDARRRIGDGDLEGAARALEDARALDPASPRLVEVSGRLSDAVRQREARARTAAGPTSPAAPRAADLPPDASAPAPSAPASPSATAPVPAAPIEVNPRFEPAAPVPPRAAPPSPSPQSTAPSPSPSISAPPTDPAPAAPIAERPKRAERSSEDRTATTAEDTRASPATRAESDEAAIRDLIANYGRAIETKDIALFRSVKPNLTRQEERRLEDGFRAVSSQRVTLTVTSLARKGDRASAVVSRRDVIEAGGRQHSSQSEQVFTFSRTASGGWVIVEIR